MEAVMTKKGIPHRNHKPRRCAECGKIRNRDCFELKTLCVFCRPPRKPVPEREPRPRIYKVFCDACRLPLDAYRKPWVGGRCIDCWPPEGTKAHAELLKVWRSWNRA